MVALYSNDLEAQYTYIETAKERNFDVLILDGVLDNHFINQLEQKLEKVTFARVDADTIDKLIAKDEEIPSKLTEDEQNKIKPVFEKSLDTKSYTVAFESMSETEAPVQITQPEFMRRMKDMQALGGGGMSFYGDMPDTYNVVVNSNHPLVYELVNDKDKAHQETLAKQLIDLALLSQNLLKGKDLADFIKRSVDIIK